ncbi:MAG: ATP-binding protein [Pseudomonadales bacterium]|nr:ATP-binding protein [Pseudomonadales bacterium]
MLKGTRLRPLLFANLSPLLCSIFFLVHSICAQANISLLSIEPEKDTYLLGSYVEFLEDPTSELTYQNVTSSDFASRFQLSESQTPNFSFTDSAYWFRLVILNEENANTEWLLEFEYPLLDYVDIYLERDGVVEHSILGDMIPFSEREVDHRNLIYKLSLAPNSKVTMHLRVQTSSSLQLPLILMSQSAFINAENSSQYIYGLFYGAILVMILYNLFIAFMVRDIDYFYYFLHILGFGAVQGSLDGYTNEMLWGEYPWWANTAIPFFIGIGWLGVSLLARSFLQLAVNAPFLNKIFTLFVVLSFGVSLGSLFLPYSVVIKVGTASAAIIALTSFIAGFVVWRRKFKAARYFLLAFTFLLFGVALFVFKTFGLLPANFFTDHIMQIGLFTEVLLLSFALSDKINILTEENRRMEQEANSKLKSEVDRQTAELKQMTESALLARTQALEAKEEAEKANRSKSEFLATMSHEIRTPMNGVLGIVDLMYDTNIDEQQTKYLRTISASGKSLLNIINDILDLSKIEAGKLDIESNTFEINSLMDECASLFSFKAAESDLLFNVLKSSEEPQYFLGDSSRIHQILTNLVGNAFKFTEAGEIRVTYDISRIPDAEDYQIKFQVIDSGIGLSDEQKQKLFKAFSQADTSTTRKYGGTGLGLIISKRLAELMNGSIGVESELGKGSTFWFTITVPASESVDLDSEFESNNSRSAANNGDGRLHVLVAEDNSVNQMVIVGMLKRFNLQPVLASDGLQAVEACQNATRPFDLILMDCEMPVLDGFGATKQIRELESAKHQKPTHIYALTAHALSEHKQQCEDAGMNGHLAKPVDKNKLEEIIRTLEPQSQSIASHGQR